MKTSCPECNARPTITSQKYYADKEYKIQYLSCNQCGHDYTIYIFVQDRAKELLNYEKAYWRMKELLDNYY